MQDGNNGRIKRSTVLIPIFGVACVVTTWAVAVVSEHRLDSLGCHYAGFRGFTIVMLSFAAAAIILWTIELILAFVYRGTNAGRVAFVAGPVGLVMALPVLVYSLGLGTFCLSF